MHVLIVLDHPNPLSLSHAVAKRFMEGVTASGHTAELADLHAEGFDPRFSMADIEADDGKPLPPDVLSEQARVNRCDAICFVFPLFWYGMPAMTKGWVDRVWTFGWAYDQISQHDKSLQKSRVGQMLIPAGANPKVWQELGLDFAMDKIWRTGTMGFFGFTDKRIKFLNGSTGSEARRQSLLEEAYECGKQLFAQKELTR